MRGIRQGARRAQHQVSLFLIPVWAIRTTGKCFVHRLDQQREAFEDKQRDATSSTVRVFLLIFERAMRMTVFFLIYKQIADDLDAKCRELEELDRKLQRLRSEQDRAAAAGEGALKLRLKREELFAKEERMAALLAAKRPAMRDVFGGDADVPVR